MRVHLMPGEGVLGRAALCDDPAVELFYRDPVRREDRALIGRSVGEDGRALLVQPHRHAAWIGVLRNTLEREESAAADNGGIDLRVPLPALHTAVRINDLRKQI